MLPQNALAMGPAPGTCNNEYDGSYVSAIITTGNQTYYPLQNNVTFNMIIGQSYNLTTIIQVPNQSSQNNSLPGSLWYSSNEIGYDQNYCSPTVNPGTNYTISMNIGFPNDYNPGQSQAISVYWAPHGYSYTVDWKVPSSSPSAPTNLNATVSNPSQINLSWTAPANNGGSAITGYKIERSTDSGNTWTALAANTGNASTVYSDGGLDHGTTYTYRVSAINSAGTSQPSNTSSATTPAITVNGSFLECCWGSLQIVGQVSNPISGINHAQLLVYAPNGNVVLNKTESTGFTDGFTISRSDGKGNYAINLTYDKTLSGKTEVPSWINNDPGITFSVSEESDGRVHILGDTLNTIQDEQASFTVISPQNSTTATYSYNLLLQGQFDYTIYTSQQQCLSSTNNPSDCNVPFTNQAFPTSGNYTIVVTHISTGVKSQQVLSYVGPATVPSAPQNLQATTASSSQINLSWSAPSNNGGSPITGYMIERSKDNGTTWSTIQQNTGSASTTYSDSGLEHSTTYTYRVSAINSAGTSTPSNTASATTLNTVPTPPTGLIATPNLTQINLAWNAPSDNGGTPVIGYKIERSTNGGSTWTVLVANTASSNTAYSDSNVLPLTTYTYRVSAINSVGTSSPSNTTAASTTSGVPSTQPPSGITLNNVQSTSGTTTSSNQMTLSSFNAGSGSNQLLVVGISANNHGATSVTFNGQPLTKTVSSFNNNAAQFWYLKSPSGTGNIVATFGGQTQAVVGAYSFANVNQTNPIPTTATNTNSASSSPSISITTKYANDWVLDLPSIYGGQKLGSPTCTQEWNTNIPSAITGASSSTTVSSPSSVACKWTASNGGDLWDDVAIEVKVAG